MPNPALRPKVEAGAAMMRNAREMRVLSDAGTDLVVDMRDAARIGGNWGFSDAPGSVAALARRTVRRLSARRRRQRHGSDGRWRREPDIQALYRAPDHAAAGERFHRLDRGQRHRRRADARLLRRLERQERLCLGASRLGHEPGCALGSTHHVRPRRRQRDGAACVRGQLPVLHRRQQVRQPVHARPFRPADAQLHGAARRQDGGGQGPAGARA